MAAKWGLREPDTPDAYRVVADVSAAGGVLVLPELTQIEIGNVVWAQVHRKLMTPAQASNAWAVVLGVPHTSTPSLPLLPVAFALAVKYDIAVYDALFVAAVRHLGCGGVTADVPLHTAVTADFPQIKLLKHW